MLSLWQSCLICDKCQYWYKCVISLVLNSICVCVFAGDSWGNSRASILRVWSGLVILWARVDHEALRPGVSQAGCRWHMYLSHTQGGDSPCGRNLQTTKAAKTWGGLYIWQGGKNGEFSTLPRKPGPQQIPGTLDTEPGNGNSSRSKL